MKELKLNSGGRKQAIVCPCGKSNRDGKFVPFNGFTDKGFCHSCNQTFAPNQQAQHDTHYDKKEIYEPIKQIPFPSQIARCWLNFHQCHNNRFLVGLKLFFGWDALKIAKKYNIGLFDLRMDEPNGNRPLSYYNGCTIFLYKDAAGYYQGGKIMKYNPYTLKREKKVFNWLHSIYSTLLLRYPESNRTVYSDAAAAYNLNACFFGEHLLREYPTASIAIVESEKTAIIANECGFFPDVLFLASGGNSGYSVNKFKCLKNRKILILPDNDILLDAEKREILENRVNELQAKNFNISIWDDLPKLYDGINAEKADLADVLLNEQATAVWNEYPQHREELEKNGFKIPV